VIGGFRFSQDATWEVTRENFPSQISRIIAVVGVPNAR
jgi:hypothetical protein